VVRRDLRSRSWASDAVPAIHPQLNRACSNFLFLNVLFGTVFGSGGIMSNKLFSNYASLLACGSLVLMLGLFAISGKRNRK
jgi:hypothetical protein